MSSFVGDIVDESVSVSVALAVPPSAVSASVLVTDRESEGSSVPVSVKDTDCVIVGRVALSRNVRVTEAVWSGDSLIEISSVGVTLGDFESVPRDRESVTVLASE